MIDYPQQLTLILTTKCNLRCKVCYQSEFSSTFDINLLSKLVNVIPKVKWLHPIGGEPFLFDLLPLYDMAGANQCKIKIITNGTCITDKISADIASYVDRLIVSIDGGSYEAYREMRGTSLTKVLEGIGKVQIRKAIMASTHPVIEINSLLTRTTIESLPELALRAKILGATCINVFYPAIHDPKILEREQLHSEEAQEKIIEAKKYIDIIEPENRGGSICRRPWNTCNIDVNGNVFGCCYGSPSLGNLNQSSFEECWFGPIAQHLRSTVNTDQEMTECRRCVVKKRV